MEDSKRFNPYVKVPPDEEIVISGIAGRFPDSDNMKQLQENFMNMVDLGSNDNRRWSNVFSNIPSRSGKINNGEKFDAEYFSMTSSEAHVTDPMCRMLLEHTYEAIIDAGVNPKELRGTKTGVFIGSCYSETYNNILYYKTQVAGLPVVRCNKYWLANSISNWLDLNGPSYTVDSACSSSLYVMAEAYRMIRSGECDAAIVGSANLCLQPNLSLQYSHLGVLSADGYCKPFDASASGFMRSEAIATVYLQKAKDARRIYATFVYAKTNCDGFKKEGIMHPSVSMQKNLLEEFYNDCGVAHEDLSYMEAHGTATLIGDPVEVNSIDQALCSKRAAPLLMGSMKSNLGHPEPASGICQVAKVLIAMETGIIPPNINYKSPRKELAAIVEDRIKIVTEHTSWNGGYVGINSFGFGGANCHVLLKSNSKNKIANGASGVLPRLVVVSGRTEEAVKTLLDDVNSRRLDLEYIALLHRLHAENIEDHPYRGYTIVGSKIARNTIKKVRKCSRERKSICFVFPGTDVTWCNIELMKLPVFAKAIEKCDAALKQHDVCVTDILMNENNITSSSIITSFVATVAVQIGLVDLLTHIGIVPDYLIGHSIGDLLCEYVDGRFAVEETILMAYYMGIAFEQSKLGVQVDANRCKYLESVRSKLLEHVNHLLPPQISKNDGVKWLGRSRINFDSPPAVAVKYYADNTLNTIPLKKIMSLVQKDTVLVEMVPHSVFQSILAKSTVTLISLCKHDQKNTVQNFLEGIGDFYNKGFQPQISNLYPSVQFPVSRGTPMISPLVRWNHTEDYYFYRYKGQERIFNRERVVSISTADEEFEFLSGHVVDGKNLLPATCSLYLIWEMIGLLRGIDHSNIPIVFENVKFVRASLLSKTNKLELILTIQEDSNNFEIIEGDDVIVSGVARVPDDITREKLPRQFLESKSDYAEEYMNTADIYKEFRLRGYQYTGIFRLLKSASVTGKIGHIKWPTNWVAFIDNMLQMKILSYDSRNIYVPTQIRKLVIDPTYHTKQMQKLPIGRKDILVRAYDSVDAIISEGIEITGLKCTAISRRLTRDEPLHEEYRFIAYHDHAMMSLKETVKMSVHIALECHEMINIRMIEYVEDNDEILLEDLVTPVVEEVLINLPSIRSKLTLVAATNRFESSSLPTNVSIVQFNKLVKDDTFLMAVGVGILTKDTYFTNRLLSNVMAGGFLLSREDVSWTYDHSLLQRNNLNIIMEKRTEREALVLLRKVRNIVKVRKIVHVNNHEFSWIDKLKDAINIGNKSNLNTRVLVVAEGDFECGVLGLVNCLQKEPGGKMVRCVFIQDKDAPKFSLQNPFYMKQLELDLLFNVLRPGKIWGCYRHFLLSTPEPRFVEYGYVIQEIRGDLSTLRWVEGKMGPQIKHRNLIRTVYATLNFKDVMIATGKLALESLEPVGREGDSLLSFEFVGFNGNGQRIMGMCPNRGISNVSTQNSLSWVIPDEWTLEEAATIPCVYATSCYALHMIGKIKKGDKILIHSGTGGIGQAAINLALHEGCEVFTTVGTPEKRKFIREIFPFISDDHIGNSRDISFEQMISQQTHGQGVDIVLNSLAEEKLQASIRCLARGGRFLEIGKYDLISDNTLKQVAFARGISFHGIMLDNVIYSKEKRRYLANLVLQKLRTHAIKPLPRKVFERTEIEAAYRYMAAGKHIGKIVIKVRDENEPLDFPILAHPRFFCEPEKSYIILGGLGGFGLELADWLILRNARKLLLTSRTGIKNGYQRSRVELWKSYGVNVQIIVGADVSDYEACAFILNSAAEMGPVDAIFNLMVIIKDSLFMDQTAETFEETFKPKAMATKTMDELSRNMCPDLRYFVIFSSVACGRGNALQSNYGMANSIMERICEKRAQDGLHGMAIQWGAISDVGVVADMQGDNYKDLVFANTLQQSVQSCLQSLDGFLVQSRPVMSSTVMAKKRTDLNREMDIVDTVSSIMGLKDANVVGHHIPLSDIGMDSMLVVQIKHTLEREFDIYLTTHDIRNLTFEKLRDIANINKQFEKEAKSFFDMEGIKFMIRFFNDLDIIPDICLELPTKQEANKERIYFIPGVEGCGSVFNSLAPKIKAAATCLQYDANNIPTCESVFQLAATILPHILTRMKNSAEFILVGYSYGSVIAIELARLLEAKNLTGRLILIDGTPDHTKAFTEQFFQFTTIQEYQNNILLGLMDLFVSTDNRMILLELSKHDTWEEKLNAFIKCIPDKMLHIISVENYKIYCTSIYKHLIALREYDITPLPPLKSSILLLKPTFSSLPSTEEDCGLSKVTEGRVQIHYVTGSHITMLDNDETAAAINGDIIMNT